MLISLIVNYGFFKSKSYYIALTGLELPLYTRLTPNSQRSSCLCLLSIGIRDMYHHVLLKHRDFYFTHKECVLGESRGRDFI